MLPLAITLVAGAVALAVWAVLSQADERATVRASLRQLDGYDVANVRDQELLKPVRERTLAPVVKALTDLGRRFTPVGYIDKVRHKHQSLGVIGTEAVDRFLAVRAATVAAIPAAFFFVFFVWKPGGLLGVMGFGLMTVALLLGPDATLNRKVQARQQEVRVKLPDVLDLLVISVEAGLGFEQALDRTVSAVPGALTEEFSRMLGEVRAGASRGDAMRNMEKRCDVAELRSFVLAILQADTFGVSIGRVLRAQADEMRIKRRQIAQERAQKAPVKMMIPMVFCVFPSIFVVVLGPAIISIKAGLAK
ncbi:MAG: type II secretion system F family protein [Actinobacteria bacterium]|nr:type II secretion system F family protein [Actinomycetota bacterium]